MRVLALVGLCVPGLASAQSMWLGETPGETVVVAVGQDVVVPVYADTSSLTGFAAWEWVARLDTASAAITAVELGLGPDLAGHTVGVEECVTGPDTETWQSGTASAFVPSPAVHVADITVHGVAATTTDPVPIAFVVDGSTCTTDSRRTLIDDGTDVIGETGCGAAWGCDSETLVAVDGEVDVGFVRGDVNGDGVVDVSDAAHLRSYLFLGGAAPVCESSGDADDNGTLDVGDSFRILDYLFNEGAGAIAPPFPGVGQDPTADGLQCAE